MNSIRKTFAMLGGATAFVLAAVAVVNAEDDPLAPWRNGVQIHAVASGERHTIHSYFNTCPESPDGKSVLFFSSTAPDGQRGEIHILNRASGEEKTFVRDLNTEDAHRAACQQWLSNGKRIAFHGERGGEWFTGVVDLETGKERVVARNRLTGWGRPDEDVLPLYSPHWNPGNHPDLDLLNVATGKLTTPVTAAEVKAAYPDWVKKSYGDKPISIFFPVLSPDLKRVFFKMASAGNGDPRSTGASARQGLVCYSLEEKRFLFLRENWGHPAWHPDKQTIVEAGNFLIDSNDGKYKRVPGLPTFRGDHPSVSPDGKLWVTDTTLEKFGGTGKEWGVVVADVRGTNYVIIDRFDNSHGAKSWRKSHPHPVFSPDGQRIYFNISSNQWTRLHVAERAEVKAAAK